ncbi:hypothetical protein GCM10027578_05110 [Spirosoma luteolum]
MSRYPTPRIRSANNRRSDARPLVIVANQYTLFGGPGLVPPIRGERNAQPSPVQPAKLLPIDEQIALRHQPQQPLFSLCDHSFVIPTGNAAKLRANLTAIETLKRISQEGRQANPAEHRLLSLYTGWGGSSQVWKQTEFEQWQQAQANPAITLDESVNRWGGQYGRTRQRLADLLTPAEQSAAEALTLNAFYTDPQIVTAIWQAVEGFGFSGGRILEPAAGIGYFIGLMPPTLRERSVWVAVEKDC